VIYLDTCALVKLVWAEEHSEELIGWLGRHEEEPLVSSVLAEIELRRTVWRVDPDAMADATAVLGELILLPIDPAVVRAAGRLPQPYLRSLDAIHLAAASGAGRPVGVRHFVTYDKRLARAAAEAGLSVVGPGAGAP
jgi:predicted nucleic acid-binding protein